MTTAVRPTPTTARRTTPHGRRHGHPVLRQSAPPQPPADGGQALAGGPGCALPPLHILAFDPQDLPPGRRSGIPAADLAEHHAQLATLRRAAAAGDARLFGVTSTAATLLLVRHRPRPVVDRLLTRLEIWGSLGLQSEQDSSLLGLLYTPDAPNLERRVEKSRAGLARLGINRTWRFDAGAL
ncbi:hypothetical protein [Kitasatospora sp. McL0602]|uniref:hypothetical protein n=1 Tax=Kitasatospora sp. McL0602 TaxID=3439530 RepID=UPI003F891BA5